MLGVAIARACKMARLMGPPPTGMAPASEYSRLRRPAARITVKDDDTPSQETTSAESAPITSSALSTMVSSTSLRSSEEASDWPTASTARTNIARRRRSLTSTSRPTTPVTAPSSPRHG